MEMRCQHLLLLQGRMLFFLQPPSGCASDSSEAKITIMLPKDWSLATFIYRSTLQIFRENDLIALGFLKYNNTSRTTIRSPLAFHPGQVLNWQAVCGGVILGAAPPEVASGQLLVLYMPPFKTEQKWTFSQLNPCLMRRYGRFERQRGDSSISIVPRSNLYIPSQAKLAKWTGASADSIYGAGRGGK